MRQSALFAKTRHQAPAGEESKNASLLLRAGYINKEMAGVYSYLPLGLIVLNNIIRLIRDEMNTLGAQEVFLTALQDPEPWQISGRWNDEVVDVWFKTKLANNTEIGLANTHEEALTRLMQHHISSYKDLPFSVYQFQTKFRNEIRARSGILRTREFLMKDLYSFSANETQHKEFYLRAQEAYMRVFTAVGLKDYTYLTVASGGSFSKYSHEFQTVSNAGEDVIYISEEKKLAINKEVYTPEVLADLGLFASDLIEKTAIEVGNIFALGTKYSKALKLRFQNEEGDDNFVYMGSYGIGPARLMGTVVEIYADKKGLVWPSSIAPFQAHLVALDGGIQNAEFLYKELLEHGVEVLYDDRQVSAGEKLADADLLGIPLRVIASARTAEQVEIKKRTEEETQLVTKTQAMQLIQSNK